MTDAGNGFSCTQTKHTITHVTQRKQNETSTLREGELMPTKQHMDEKDWIILRLLRLALESGSLSSHSDVIKTINWMEQRSLHLTNMEGETLPPYSGFTFIMKQLERLREDEKPQALPRHWRRS